jgi:SAM-dependent methyltransferase
VPIDLDWDHNAWYQSRILRALPADLGTVLDVGCGAGSFAARLAERARHVDAVDRSPRMVALARARVPADAVTSISALHHLDLEQVLPRLARALRPGGLLVAVALPRADLPRELPVEVLAALGNRFLGASFRLEQSLTGRRRYAHEASVREMPMQDPVLTTRQVREQAARLLPGARVRRLPFWRYELRWRRPAVSS